MTWENGGMVDNGAMFGMVNDVHRNELGAERHHIQICFDGLVFF